MKRLLFLFALLSVGSAPSAEKPSLVTLNDGRTLDGMYDTDTGTLMLFPELKIGIKINKSDIDKIEESDYQKVDNIWYCKDDIANARKGLLKFGKTWVSKEEYRELSEKSQEEKKEKASAIRAKAAEETKDAAREAAVKEENIKKGLILVDGKWLSKDDLDKLRGSVQGTIGIQTKGGTVIRLAKGRVGMLDLKTYLDVFMPYIHKRVKLLDEQIAAQKKGDNLEFLKLQMKFIDFNIEEGAKLESAISGSPVETDFEGRYALTNYPGKYKLIAKMDTVAEDIYWAVDVEVSTAQTVTQDLDHNNYEFTNPKK